MSKWKRIVENKVKKVLIWKHRYLYNTYVGIEPKITDGVERFYAIYETPKNHRAKQVLLKKRGKTNFKSFTAAKEVAMAFMRKHK